MKTESYWTLASPIHPKTDAKHYLKGVILGGVCAEIVSEPERAMRFASLAEAEAEKARYIPAVVNSFEPVEIKAA